MKELREKKIPFTIRRYMPDGRWVAVIQHWSGSLQTLFNSIHGRLVVVSTISMYSICARVGCWYAWHSPDQVV